jgi:exodeoxyribonuclease-3
MPIMLHDAGMRIATWNVNSVRVRTARMLAWLEKHQPDVLCLQELKCEAKDFPSLDVSALGYRSVLHGQKTYNGVAILAKDDPTDVVVGMGDGVEDPQSRLVHAVVSGVHIISAYFPNGGEIGNEKYTYKLAWMARLDAYLARFDMTRDSVVLTGDFNVAPFDDDIARPKEWLGGVLANDEVRAAVARFRDRGMVDAFRPFHPEGGVYTWWDYRGGGFERGNGLRIDLAYVSQPVARRVIGAIVDKAERGGEGPSDHAPVVIELR